MANFRIYRGRWVVVTRDIGNLKKGQIVQVLEYRYLITFVGVHGTYPTRCDYIKPLELQEQQDEK